MDFDSGKVGQSWSFELETVLLRRPAEWKGPFSTSMPSITTITPVYEVGLWTWPPLLAEPSFLSAQYSWLHEPGMCANKNLETLKLD